MHYISPSQRLFQTRHKVSRKDLREVDLILDVDMDSDLYGVPLVGAHAINVSGSESEVSSVFSDLSSDSAMDICSRMQSNLSVDFVIQHNKRRLSQEEQTLRLMAQDGGGRTQAKREMQRLKDENQSLLRRRNLLAQRWNQARGSPTLLIEARRDGLYWFGLPSDLRILIYNCCLMQVPSYPKDRMFCALRRCLDDESLAEQIFSNLRYRQSLSSHTAIVSTKIQSRYPGLFFHIQKILKLDVWQDFARPLLYYAICNALEQHAADGIALELLDIFVVSTAYRELDSVLLDDFLMSVLAQTHYKFFDDQTVKFRQQVRHMHFELVAVLESMRQPRTQVLMSAKIPST